MDLGKLGNLVPDVTRGNRAEVGTHCHGEGDRGLRLEIRHQVWLMGLLLSWLGCHLLLNLNRKTA